MMRALYTAASGMTSQQIAVDTVANNLANVNTTGYKQEKAEFKSLLYQTLQTKSTSANGTNKPIGAQVGSGVRNAAITSEFTQGTPTETGDNSDFSITGNGFFAVKGEDGTTYYTRNGDFNYSLGGSGIELTTSEGYPVLDTAGNAITFATSIDTSTITADSSGALYYTNAAGKTVSLGKSIGLYQFSNAAGLDKTGDSLYAATAASGAAINESTNTTLANSTISQGYLESSNVSVADEMVNLIVAQRAYEMNSKAIQAADDMMQQANNLR